MILERGRTEGKIKKDGHRKSGKAGQEKRNNLPAWAVIAAGLGLGAGLIWLIEKKLGWTKIVATETHQTAEPKPSG